jgi:hypothetical protein
MGLGLQKNQTLWILSVYCFLQSKPLRSQRRYRNFQVQKWLGKIPLPPLITGGGELEVYLASYGNVDGAVKVSPANRPPAAKAASHNALSRASTSA